jgi:polysaccharide deacetylase family protein (PEP-CTERM system associated)
MKNALTIDLEDYYQVTAFARENKPQEWDSHASRVEGNTERILELLANVSCRATFFCLGWVAEKYPALIRRVSDQGHEIACHSHLHRLVYSMTPAEFREDTHRAKGILEGIGGHQVRGYRAPSFSITRGSTWAFEILGELGFSYDSSIFPVRHPSYGMPDAPRFPFIVDTPSGPLVEFPMPTLSFAGRRAPFGGGAYLRLLPEWYARWAIRFINQSEKQPVCVYLHPWELDTKQPRMAGSPSARLRHYFGLGSVERKLNHLVKDFEFEPLGELVDKCSGLPRISLAEA